MEESLKKTTLIKVSKLKELLPAQLDKIRQVKLPRNVILFILIIIIRRLGLNLIFNVLNHLYETIL